MYLCILSIGEWLYESIPIALTFHDIESKSGYHRFAESFGLVDSSWVICFRDEVVNGKEAA